MEILLLVLVGLAVVAWFSLKGFAKGADHDVQDKAPYKLEPPLKEEAPVVVEATVEAPAKKTRKPRAAKATSTKTKKSASTKSKKV